MPFFPIFGTNGTGGGWGFPHPFSNTPITTGGTIQLVQWVDSSTTTQALYQTYQSSFTQGLYQAILNQSTNLSAQQMMINPQQTQMLNYPYPPRPISSPNIIPSTRRERIRAEAMQQNDEQWAEARLAEAARRTAAKERARDLLLSFLTKEQRAEFESNKNFIVEAASGVKYRITYGRIANIQVLHDRPPQVPELVRHRLCVHPENDDLPVEDVMLSQLLHLMDNELELLRRANIHP